MNDDGERTVQQGSQVRLRDADGQERVLLIRRDQPEWSAMDSISADTPLARALIGHRAGDEVEVRLHPAVPVHRVAILSIQ